MGCCRVVVAIPSVSRFIRLVSTARLIHSKTMEYICLSSNGTIMGLCKTGDTVGITVVELLTSMPQRLTNISSYGGAYLLASPREIGASPLVEVGETSVSALYPRDFITLTPLLFLCTMNVHIEDRETLRQEKSLKAETFATRRSIFRSTQSVTRLKSTFQK